jgi:hypothetical protein
MCVVKASFSLGEVALSCIFGIALEVVVQRHINLVIGAQTGHLMFSVP